MSAALQTSMTMLHQEHIVVHKAHTVRSSSLTTWWRCVGIPGRMAGTASMGWCGKLREVLIDRFEMSLSMLDGISHEFALLVMICTQSTWQPTSAGGGTPSIASVIKDVKGELLLRPPV